ncbi:MAG: tetratricopeptide repeat protein [Elusimicrobia bacterium]|nr:tetratricopeptide repeat protein [Elusimicrobiota bacterium]
MILRSIAVLSAALSLAAAPARCEDEASRGVALLTQGRYQEAAAAFDAALKRRPEDASALANRCTSRYKLGDHEGAIADFEAAVRLKPGLRPALAPSMSDAYYRRALRLADAGADDAAADALYASVRLDRKNALPYNELGFLAVRNRQSETALDYLGRALKLAPDLAPAYANRAAALLALHRAAEAFADMDRAILLNPKNGAFFALRARVSLALRRRRQAGQDATRAVELEPAQAAGLKDLLPADK